MNYRYQTDGGPLVLCGSTHMKKTLCPTASNGEPTTEECGPCLASGMIRCACGHHSTCIVRLQIGDERAMCRSCADDQPLTARVLPLPGRKPRPGHSMYRETIGDDRDE